jgi:hypothetical protein
MFIQVVPFRERATTQMVRPRGLVDQAGPVGLVHYELLRGGRILVPKTLAFNAVNNFAKNSFLDGFFNNGGRLDSYCIGLVDASGFSAFNATDLIGAHSGWGEFTNYTVSGNGTVRATWGYGSATAQAVTNSSPCVYDFTGSGSVYGIFITGDPTKNGTGELLWSTAGFAAPLAVTTGDQLRVTYTVQL